MAFGNFEFPNANVYDSDLREVLRRLQDLVNRYNDLVSDMEATNANVNNALQIVNGLKAEWANLENVVDDLIDKGLEDFTKKFDLEISNLQALIDNIDSNLITIKEYIDNGDDYVFNKLYRIIAQQVADLQEQIDDILDKIGEKTEMYNPLRGYNEDIPKCVRDLWESERYLGLSNVELENYGLTNQELADRNLCNYEFTINLRGWLEDWGVRSIYHAGIGNKTYPSNVDSYNLTIAKGTMSNEQYTNLNLTNEEYEALNLTNEEYLSYKAENVLHHSDLVGFINTNGTGLSNTEYSTLGIEV